MKDGVESGKTGDKGRQKEARLPRQSEKIETRQVKQNCYGHVYEKKEEEEKGRKRKKRESWENSRIEIIA